MQRARRSDEDLPELARRQERGDGGAWRESKAAMSTCRGRRGRVKERQAGGEERSRGSSTGPAGEVRRGEAAEPGGIRDGGSRRWRNSRAARLDDSGEEPREEDGGLDARRAAVGEPWGLGSATPGHGVGAGLSVRRIRQQRRSSMSREEDGKSGGGRRRLAGGEARRRA